MLGQLRRQPMSSVGIAPGASRAHDSQALTNSLDAKGQSAFAWATSVTIDSVLFEDGRLVGPDKAGSYDQLTARLQAEKDVHELLTKATDVTQAWVTLEGIASGQIEPPTDKSQSQKYQRRYRAEYQTFSTELVRVRSKLGDAAAMDLAHGYVFDVKIVRGE